MGLDDPVVIALIVGAVILLFGSSKIPQLARSLGTARREFDNGWKGQIKAALTPSDTQNATPTMINTNGQPSLDPLVIAAQREGIETSGKTRDQIASELAWKLNKK